MSFKCAILAENWGWVEEGTSFRAWETVLMVIQSGLMRGVVVGGYFSNHSVSVLLKNSEGSIVDAGAEIGTPVGEFL